VSGKLNSLVALSHKDRNTHTHWLVRPRAGLNAVEMSQNSCSCRQSNLGLSGHSPITVPTELSHLLNYEKYAFRKVSLEPTGQLELCFASVITKLWQLVDSIPQRRLRFDSRSVHVGLWHWDRFPPILRFPLLIVIPPNDPYFSSGAARVSRSTYRVDSGSPRPSELKRDYIPSNASSLACERKTSPRVRTTCLLIVTKQA
jgi:hypothetical protein